MKPSSLVLDLTEMFAISASINERLIQSMLSKRTAPDFPHSGTALFNSVPIGTKHFYLLLITLKHQLLTTFIHFHSYIELIFST